MLINYYGLKRDVSASLPKLVCVCVCVCVCLCVCVYVCMYVCIYIYIYTHTHTHTDKNIGTLAILSDNSSNCKCFGIHVLNVFVCTATTQKIFV